MQGSVAGEKINGGSMSRRGWKAVGKLWAFIFAFVGLASLLGWLAYRFTPLFLVAFVAFGLGGVSVVVYRDAAWRPDE